MYEPTELAVILKYDWVAGVVFTRTSVHNHALGPRVQGNLTRLWVGLRLPALRGETAGSMVQNVRIHLRFRAVLLSESLSNPMFSFAGLV